MSCRSSAALHLRSEGARRSLSAMSSTNSGGAGPAIEVHDLRKSYGEVNAVRGVSFEVARGEVFCLLGPNGAGKTNTVEILEGYRSRSGGSVAVLGIEPASASRTLHEQV